MHRSPENPWLTRFAWVTAAATLVLLCFGGLVTSHGAGLAVPDWPNTYGYNLFFFPISHWVGGIFYEHTHRLVASGVGLLTTVLAVWLWLREPRSLLRWLGVIAFLLVVLQGVMGGLRVTLLKDELGVVHGILAQIFFVLVCTIALLSNPRWTRYRCDQPRLRGLLAVTTALIFVQLALGALMRHRHAGLAVPDFPLAHGRLWPATDPASIARYNAQRVELNAARPIAPLDVHLHMTHRLGAVLIVGLALRSLVVALRGSGRGTPLRRLVVAWAALLVAQAGLGIATVLTDKSADLATAHVAGGATALAVGFLAWLLAGRTAPVPDAAPPRPVADRCPAGSSPRLAVHANTP